jgi:uncharacterized protein (TIGR02246 family)
MRHRSVFAVVLLLVVLVVTARSHAAASGAQIVDAAWIAAVKANDLDAVMKCYAPDAVMWLPNAPSARGAKAIRAAYEGLLSANTVKDATLSDVTYRTVGNTSVAWGRFSLTLAPKAGGDPVVMTGRFTEAAERRGGKWVYIVDHASAEPAPPVGK